MRIGRQLDETLSEHGFGASDGGAPRADRRGPRRGAAAERRRVPQALSAPALGRAAAARRAGDGIREPSARDRARRADDGARRHDAGTRARDGARPVRRARRRGRLREPRPGRRRDARDAGGSHVRRPAGRGRADGGAVPPSAASVHAPARRGDPGAVRHPRARGHTGDGAPSGPPPGRLLLRAALHVRARRVPCGPASARARRRGARRAVHPACSRPGRRRGGTAGSGAHARDRGRRSARRRPRSLRLVRRSAGAVRRRPGDQAARVSRARRRVGLRQDDARTLRRRAPRGVHGCDLVPRPAVAARRACTRRRHASGDPVRLPEPLQLPQPAQDDRADHRTAAAPVLRSRRLGRAASCDARRSIASSSRRAASTGTRTSSPAASASAWPSPGRSSRSRSCSCATRSPPLSTCPCRRRSWTCSPSFSGSSTSACCSSRTTSR